MTARKQTGYCEFNRLVLAYNNFTNLLYESVKVVGHSEIICGNSALRKQDMNPVAGGSVTARAAGCCCFRRRRNRVGMGIAITLCNKPEGERRDHEQHHSF